MKVSDLGLAELAGHEAIVTRRYKDSVGVWTVGVGQTWNADEVSTVLTTVITLAGLAWAWYGRETTTRPLA
jgi:GH24 family phage-related lysozyme (muramidase)